MTPERIHRAMQDLERRGVHRPRSGFPAPDARTLAETFLGFLDIVIDGNGVEELEDDGRRAHWRGVAALYVDRGDDSAVTAIYDVDEEVMTIKSLADFIAEKETEGATFA